MTFAVDTCVVGAGLGGLSIALRLEKEGADYVVLDKGRTPGGRAATRRFAGARFDHGLPWLSDEGALTGELVNEGFEAGLLVSLETDDTGGRGWYSPGGISALGKRLAVDLNVRSQVRVTAIQPDGQRLRLLTFTEEEESVIEVRRRLFVTAPLPQALDLVGPLVPDWPLPELPPYEKCVVAMVRLDPERLPSGPAKQRLPDGTGDLVLDHLKFPVAEPGASVRFSSASSDLLFDRDEAAIKLQVSSALEAITGPIPHEMIQLMKWRYANGSGVVAEPILESTVASVRVAVCGDAFFGGAASGTEASLMSCRAAYEALA